MRQGRWRVRLNTAANCPDWQQSRVPVCHQLCHQDRYSFAVLTGICPPAI